jgi:hypothetical protein
MKLINPEVRIETVNKCTANCTICPREKMTRRQTVMPYEHFVKLVNQSLEMGAKLISIFGFGEPLLDGGIYRKISYCEKRGLETFITTNASLLTSNASRKLVAAGLTKIRFSMHGMNRDYERVHVGLRYADFLKNISNFLIINDGPYHIKTSLSVIPMNHDNAKHIRNVWESSFDEMEIWKPHNWTTGRPYRDLSLRTKKTCGRPFRGPIQIQADGKMVVCCFDFNGELEVGDTYRSTLREILNSKRYEIIRSRHRVGIHDGYLCESCDQRNLNDNPLIYSNVDKELKTGCTSSTKFNLEEK